MEWKRMLNRTEKNVKVQKNVGEGRSGLQNRLRSQTVYKVCAFIYTSGLVYNKYKMSPKLAMGMLVTCTTV
jgi:hypothetical protein